MSDGASSQAQSQVQTVTLNLKNAGDPALEAHIFGELHSVGRQLGRISAVLEVVLDALQASPALQLPEATAALEAFRAVQQDIEQAKEARRPETSIIEVLEQLRAEDRVAYDSTVGQLRAYLDDVELA